MRIAVDVQSLYTESRNHGIGTYVYNLVESILKRDSANDYFLVGLANTAYPEVQFPGSYEYIPIDLGRTIKPGEGPTDELAETYSRCVGDIIRRHDIEVYHLTSGLSTDVVFPDPSPKNLVVTVYDLIPLLLDYLYKWPPELVVDYIRKLNLLKRYATKMVAISNNTRRDLIRCLDIPEARVETVYLGVDSKFTKLYRNRKPADRGYITYVGGYEYRKNVERLIKAYSKLPVDIRKRHNLLLDCEAPDAIISKLKDLCVSCGVEGETRRISAKSDRELLDLYGMCSLLVYPSLYEGFGLPPLEAMASGVPVVASNTSSIPEVVGDAALLVDPYDEDDIARKIELVLTDEGLRAELIAKGLERSKLFDWGTCANRTTAIYEETGRTPTTRKDARKRHRIAFFSPLNPQMSGISDYSEELLAELRNYFDIDLFVDNFTPTSKEILCSFDVYAISEFESRLGRYDIAIYHVGNNPLHERICRTMQRHPGVMVLHDTNLHTSIFHCYLVAAKRPLEYLEEMALSHGEAGVVEARRVISGGYPLFQQFPLNKKALLYSLGTVVFTRIAIERLAARTPIVCIPHGVRSIDATNEGLNEEKNRLRKAHGIAANTFMICTAGFLAFERRLDVCLKAFDRLRKIAPEAKYYIVGTFIADVVKSKLLDEVERLGLGSYVILIERPKTVRELEDYIMMSDIVLNLRYPASGGASGTLSRALAKGKPVIASQIPEFAEYPDDCTWKVDVADYEVELLFQYLERLYRDPDLRRTMSHRALEYAKGCDWKVIASRYADFIDSIIVGRVLN